MIVILPVTRESIQTVPLYTTFRGQFDTARNLMAGSILPFMIWSMFHIH